MSTKEIVCNELQIPLDQLESKTKKRKVVDARIIIAQILRTKDNLVLVDIGMILSRDRSTIIYYSAKFRDLYWSSPDFKQKYDRCLKNYNL